MGNRAKQRGTAAETATVRYMREHGFPFVERRALHGSADRGDVAGVPEWMLEVKAVAAPSYGVWMKEAEVERANAGVPNCAVIHKATGVGDPASYRVVMTLAQFCRLLRKD
jgi:hypothetical protein